MTTESRDDRRLETFVDAAFAFALTLLVISFDAVPQSYEELLLALRGIPAFVASFAIMVMLWVAHHGWSRRYRLDNVPSMLVSLALVMVVMVYAYPLRSMMAVTFSFMTGGWAPSDFTMQSVDQVRGLFTIYGAGFSAATLCLVLLHWLALRSADRLALTPAIRAQAIADVAVWSLVCGTGLLSVVFAQTLPNQLLGMCGWIYATLAITAPLTGVLVERRARRRLGAD